jgi:hypothetical protein
MSGLGPSGACIFSRLLPRPWLSLSVGFSSYPSLFCEVAF